LVPPTLALPEKVSPHLNKTRLVLSEELTAALSLDEFKTAAPAGHPPLPATGVPEAETQVVAVPLGPPAGAPLAAG
jgi:hypothetical protein